MGDLEIYDITYLLKVPGGKDRLDPLGDLELQLRQLPHQQLVC